MARICNLQEEMDAQVICAICKLPIQSLQRPSIQFADGSEIHTACYKPLCAICHTLVRLEESDCDANGRAIHPDCHIQSIQQHR